jgi:hypothetical protein
VIRRLLVATTLVAGLLALGAGPADADVPSNVGVKNGNIACLYNVKPLNVGLCIGV